VLEVLQPRAVRVLDGGQAQRAVQAVGRGGVAVRSALPGVELVGTNRQTCNILTATQETLEHIQNYPTIARHIKSTVLRLAP
jgi:hypothetical protein